MNATTLRLGTLGLALAMLEGCGEEGEEARQAEQVPAAEEPASQADATEAAG